jgi:hypothetical protein
LISDLSLIDPILNQTNRVFRKPSKSQSKLDRDLLNDSPLASTDQMIWPGREGQVKN